MRSRLKFLTPVVAVLGLASAQEPAPPAFVNKEAEAEPIIDKDFDAPKLVRAQVEFIEVPHEILTKLLYGNPPESVDGTLLRNRVQELIDKKEAKIFETQIATARSGLKAQVESISEFIFPTEYEPPNAYEPPPSVEGKTAAALPATSRFEPFTPTAFETRNVGSTLQIEPTLGEDGRIIDLKFDPEITWHTDDTVWAELKDGTGGSSKIVMPRFYTLKISTGVTCVSGKYVFAGALSPKTDAGDLDNSRKFMIFVKCDAVTIK